MLLLIFAEAAYAEALLVLEQGLTSQSQEGTEATENTKGVVLLAISSLLSERFAGQGH